MMRQVISVFFICATILYAKAVPPRCTRADIKKLNSTVIHSKSELTEAFNSKLQVIKNDIKSELANEIGNLSDKLTNEINQNEEKLKIDVNIVNAEVLKVNNKLDQIKNDIKGELNDEIDQLTGSINQKFDDLNKKLIEAFNSTLVQMKSAIKTELTVEINQNEDKLNGLKTQLTKTTNELSDCACERKRQRSLIYYAGPYIYTFAAAKAYCKSKGHKIATPAQIQAAFDLGMSECNWGWVEDGSLRSPQQMPFTNNWCGKRGLNTWLNYDQLKKRGVYCATNPGP
ncbi:unnamed protein product [Owenia fusiformis]|uniref:Link domain-containing protein n=1 Tax=Owenia fusiformis TaxID=6347 RepID=A0A8S4NFM8_OWEFU|nr:unnamed protein product [Owenia fusiformis]